MIYLILGCNSNNLPLMKSLWVTILIFLSCYFAHAITKPSFKDKSEFNTFLSDSIFESKDVLERRSENVVAQYELLKKDGFTLGTKDYRRLAESHAYLGESEKATYYLRNYIKTSFDTNVLLSDKFDKISTTNGYQTLMNTYLPKINGWILLFIFSGIIGLFVSITINLRKKGDRIANILIGLFVLFHSLFILHLALYLTNYVYRAPHSLWATITFSFLYGPLLYFYFKRIANEYTFKRSDFLHLLPTIAVIFYFTPFYFFSGRMKQQIIFSVDSSYINTVHVILILKSLSLIVYSFLIYKVYVKKTKTKVKVDRHVHLWQRNLVYLNILFALTYSVYAFVIGTNVVFDRSKSVMLYSQVFVLALIVLYVAYTAYVQPRVFSKKYLFSQLPSKYLKSGLTESYSHELKEQLLRLLIEEKVYKTNDINLNTLSEKMHTTRHNLSQVINEHFDMNFFNLINMFRIQEAQRILADDSYHNLNIIDVAYDIGFNNKVTFNKAFKEETGLTPTQYIKSIQRTALG